MKFIFKETANRIYQRLVRWNNPFYFHGIPNADYSISNQVVTLKRFNLVFDQQEGKSLIHGYPYALKIHDALGGRFSFFNGNVFLEFQNLKFQINSAEELFT